MSMRLRNNATKILCTIGPASSDVGTLMKMIRAGMDVARLNFSHGTHETHLQTIMNIREASRRTGVHVGILQDLGGPKIRVGAITGGAVALQRGATISFTTKQIEGTAQLVSTTYARLARDAKKGDQILLDDGTLAVRVRFVRREIVTCKVTQGGILKSNKGMNLPGVKLSVPAMTKKDEDDLLFGVANDVDYIALSFVRTVRDVHALKKKLVAVAPKGRRIPIIAKIEKPEAIDHLDAIIEASDGVMVARGDLGVETAPEDVPMIQKDIVRRCNKRGIPVIIATQMLESMIQNPRPTRAEASDVANAVLDGADAVMLSGETSTGLYPVQSVRVMDNIIAKAEEATVPSPDDSSGVAEQNGFFDSVAKAACVLAHRVGAKAIVPLTHSGATAAAISRYRPIEPILAITGREKVVRRLALHRGVRGLIVENFEADSETSISKIKTELKRLGYVQSGDIVVFTAGIPLMKRGTTNTVRVETI